MKTFFLLLVGPLSLNFAFLFILFSCPAFASSKFDCISQNSPDGISITLINDDLLSVRGAGVETQYFMIQQKSSTSIIAQEVFEVGLASDRNPQIVKHRETKFSFTSNKNIFSVSITRKFKERSKPEIIKYSCNLKL
jgi:hypothetical protein